jgi:hypothetical protein
VWTLETEREKKLLKQVQMFIDERGFDIGRGSGRRSQIPDNGSRCIPAEHELG